MKKPVIILGILAIGLMSLLSHFDFSGPGRTQSAGWLSGEGYQADRGQQGTSGSRHFNNRIKALKENRAQSQQRLSQLGNRRFERRQLQPIVKTAAEQPAAVRGDTTRKKKVKKVSKKDAKEEKKEGEQTEEEKAKQEEEKRQADIRRMELIRQQELEAEAQAFDELQREAAEAEGVRSTGFVATAYTQADPTATEEVVNEAGLTADQQVVMNAWRSKLLSSKLDSKEYLEFTRRHLSGEIPDIIFYTLIDEALSDSRQRARQLAIQSLGQVSSLASFERLVAASAPEAKNDDLAADFQSAFEQFASLGRIGVLQSVIRDSANKDAVLIAARLITVLGNDLVQRLSNSANPGDVTELAFGEAEYSIINDTLQLLMALLTQTKEPQVVSRVNTAIASLETVLDLNPQVAATAGL